MRHLRADLPAAEESLRASGMCDAVRRVLVVEDERIIARDLVNALSDLGYASVGIAATAADAMRLTLKERPDLVLMDIRLAGGVDGVAAAAAIRAAYSVPVVFLSANADPETVKRALEAVPCGYLTKPYSERTLYATIEVALSRHEADLAMRLQRDALDVANRALERQAAQLREEALVDTLTGLHNRRHFDATLARAVSFAERKKTSIGLIMLDVDHFKQLNDGFGHAAGDAVLARLGAFVRAELRPYDTACRYGGEELGVILPGASLDEAFLVAKRLCDGLPRIEFTAKGCVLPPVTASFGVAAYPNHAAGEIVRAADAALYEAKRTGRDRVIRAS